MSEPIEIRDSKLARDWLAQGLAMARAAPLAGELGETTIPALLDLAGSGEPLPPAAVAADIVAIVLGIERRSNATHPTLPSVDHVLIRRYEDFVLGRMYSDSNFQRGAEGVLRYLGEERVRAAAYLIAAVWRRLGGAGVVVSPAVLRTAGASADWPSLVAAGKSSLASGMNESLRTGLESAIAACSTVSDLLAPEDLFELETGVALVPLGQRFALRQAVQAAERLDQRVPKRRPPSQNRARQVATQLLAEDAYPVGGFTSISTRGTLESLLHSQLAFMEKEERPDLFDIKYLRDELYYYSRDENNFFRRRQTIFFLLQNDLGWCRVKDPEAPWQRIVLALGALAVLQRRLSDWLSNEALEFRFLAATEAEPLARPLTDELELLSLLFQPAIATGGATIETAPQATWAPRIAAAAKRSLCRVLSLTSDRAARREFFPGEIRLAIVSPIPRLDRPDEEAWRSDDSDPFGAWSETISAILADWT